MSKKKEYICSRCGIKFKSTDKSLEKAKTILCPDCLAKKNETLLNIRNILTDEITRLPDFSPGGAYLEYFDEITYLNNKEKRSRVEMAVQFEIIIIRFFTQQKETVRNNTYKDYNWIAILVALYEAYYMDYSDSAWPSKHAFRFSKYIQETTDKEVKKFTATKQSGGKLPDSGEDTHGASGSLDELYCFSRKRVRNVAKNEVEFLANAIRHEKLKASGQKTHMWVTFHDERVRPTHSVADFQVKPIDEPFDVGGYKMMFPGDDSLGAPPEEIINCRCIEM